MRVKISYGADIEEVPEEVDQLYTYVSGKIRSLTVQTEHIEDALAQEDLEMTLPLIDKMRRTLASIDQRLADIEMISTGFLNHKQGGLNVQEGRPNMATTGNGTHHNKPSEPSGV